VKNEGAQRPVREGLKSCSEPYQEAWRNLSRFTREGEIGALDPGDRGRSQKKEALEGPPTGEKEELRNIEP